MAYTGDWMEIPMGDGLLTDSASSEIPHTKLIKAINLNFAPGYLEKAPGALLYNRSGAFPNSIVALIDYWPTYAQQRMLGYRDGLLFATLG